MRDLLDFGSGLDWLETYENEPLTSSSVLQMLYGDGAGDMARFVATHPRRDVPGSTYMYSSGDTNLLAGVLNAAMSSGHTDSWPHDVLLDRIGASGATWERDGSGVIVGSSHLWATPRDFARLGLLLAEEGCWNGDQVVSADWVEQMASVQPPIQNAAWDRATGASRGGMCGSTSRSRSVAWTRCPGPRCPRGPTPPAGTGGRASSWSPASIWWSSAPPMTGPTGSPSTDSPPWRWPSPAVGPVPTEAPGPLGRDPPHAGAQPRPGLRGRRPPARDRVRREGACSCAFVMERSKAWCADWLRVRPDVARFRVDNEDRTVTARALGLARSEARYIDAQQGCVLVR